MFLLGKESFFKLLPLFTELENHEENTIFSLLYFLAFNAYFLRNSKLSSACDHPLDFYWNS